MKARALLLILASSLASCVPAVGQLLPSLWKPTRITRVIDGDTYEVLLNSQKKRVRLLNVDCPELTQPFGRQATDSVKRLLVVGRVVLLRPGGTDLYGRVLGHIKLPNYPVLGVPQPATALDSLLVVRGWAWSSGSDGNPFSGPRSAEHTAAAAAYRGLWKCSSPSSPVVPPRIWRGLSKQNKNAYRGNCTW